MVLIIRLVDKFAAELKKYQLICHYCGAMLDQKIINGHCDANTRPQGATVSHTEEKPDKSYNGNRRHFFGTPRADLVTGNKFIEKVPGRLDERSPFENKEFKSQYKLFLGTH